MSRVDARRTQACHWLLLRTAGWVADELIARCRTWLSQGRLREVARAIAHAAIAQRLRLTEPDLDLLTELLATEGSDCSALEILDITDIDPMPPFGFAPTRWQAEIARIPSADMRTAHAPTVEPDCDSDRAVVRVAAGDPTVRGVWRAWRFCGNAAWPPPRRVYVLETEPHADLPGVEAGAREACRLVGDRHPQIEVYPGPAGNPTGGPDPAYQEPPSYQRLARDNGALLWARRPDPGIRLLTMYDDRGGGSAPGPVLEGLAHERDRLLDYLCSGVPVALTPALGRDIYHPELPPVVPMNYRTDGFWLWSDASTYYLTRYPVRPDPAFVADLRARRHRYPVVDGASIHRARALLLTSEDVTA
jgi:hypothetical protein